VRSMRFPKKRSLTPSKIRETMINVPMMPGFKPTASVR